MRVGYQTIIFGEGISNFEHTLDAVSSAGYAGIELAQRPERLGSPSSVTSFDHLATHLGDHNLELVGLANGSLKERMAFCGSKTGPHYLYVDSWDAQVAPAAIARGFTLALHVHAYMPVRSLDDAAVLLDTYPKLKWLPDTGHLRVVGEDIIRALRLAPSRLAAVHLKDWTPIYGRSTHRYSRGFTELGLGIVPLEQVLRELDAMSFKGWLIVEQDCSCGDPLDSLFASAIWLYDHGRLPDKPRRPSPPSHATIGYTKLGPPASTGEMRFLTHALKAVTQDAERAYFTIAQAYTEIVSCKLITVWMVDLAHDVLSLRATTPSTVPYAHSLTPNQCLSGITVERHAVTDFDLTSSQPGAKYGREQLSYHAPQIIAQLGLARMLSLPVFDTCNKNRIRLIVNLFPADTSASVSAGQLSWCCAQTALILDSILDRSCLNALAAASFQVGLGKSAKILATEICSLVRTMNQCEGVTLFIVNPTRDRLEAIGTTGIQWFVPQDERFYRLGEGLTGKVWETRRTKICFSTLREPDHRGKSAELTASAPHSCLLVPLLDSQEAVVGILRCQNKRIQSLDGAASFSDDDVAIIEALGQAMLPHIALLFAEEHRHAAVERLAHELQRPATAIRNAVQLMRNDLRRRRTSTEGLFEFDYLGDVGSWSELMIGLIQNADFFGTRGDLMVLKPTRTKLMADLIAPAVRQIEMLLKNNRFSPSSIEYSRLEQVPPLWVDRNKMQQVIFNLLSNAIKYAFSDPRSFHIEIDGLRDGDHFRIDFRDWGEGIPAGFEERVFEEGFRAPRSDGRHVVGQGFGLWIVRTILQAHRGDVKVTKRHLPTQISIYLPISLASNPPETSRYDE